jgi:hypothetical protein
LVSNNVAIAIGEWAEAALQAECEFLKCCCVLRVGSEIRVFPGICIVIVKLDTIPSFIPLRATPASRSYASDPPRIGILCGYECKSLSRTPSR